MPQRSSCATDATCRPRARLPAADRRWSLIRPIHAAMARSAIKAAVPRPHGVSTKPHRAKTETGNRYPLGYIRGNRDFEQQMKGQTGNGDGPANTDNHAARRSLEATIEHRIARPYQRAGKGREITR